MAAHHFSRCPQFPPRERMVQLLAEEKQKGADGKEEQKRDAVKTFFRDAALKMGLVDSPESWGILYARSCGDGNEKDGASTEEKVGSNKSEPSSSPSRPTRRETRYRKRLAKDASNASVKVSPRDREIATRNSAKVSPSPTATSHAPIKAPMGLGASAPLLTPTAANSDHYQGHDKEALQLVDPPTFESILNFPQGALRKKRGPNKGGGKTKTNEMRICIMCGLSCPTASNKKKRDGDDTPVVPAQNSCLLYTSPSPRDKRQSRMPSSA